MSTTLCLDFGNTRMKAGLFAGNKLQQFFIFHNDPIQELNDLLDEHKSEYAILSSVITHDPELESILRRRTRLHVLSHVSNLPFAIPVGKPETVGTDRLAIAAAAVHLFPRQHTLVIALGTCITYNFINRHHELIGGSISPGMDMRFRSMHEYTAKLPLIKGNWNVPLIGYDTVSNMQSGVILGMAKEIDGIINAYKERFANFNAVLTGGNLPFFESHLKNKIFADPDLIFKGLYAISQVNHA
jgi:type III pantothenate kinase